MGFPAGKTDGEINALIEELGDELDERPDDDGPPEVWHRIEGDPVWSRALPREPELIPSAEVVTIEPRPLRPAIREPAPVAPSDDPPPAPRPPPSSAGMSRPPVRRPWSERDEDAITRLRTDRSRR